MIFVNGVPFSSADSSSSSQDGSGNTLVSLMAHPELVSASNKFKSTLVTKVSDTEGIVLDGANKPMKCVYVFQREYATVDPELVDFVGTDEATTCVGVAIRNSRNGRTSVAHMDSPKVVDTGLCQMLAALDTSDNSSEFDVHLVGGYVDISDFEQGRSTRPTKRGKMDGVSLPLCRKIIEALQKNSRKFCVQTLFILHNNTRKDPDGNTCPIFDGFMVETKSGSVIPASFDRTTRCPDNVVRGIRVSTAFEDPSWKGKLLETYDTDADQFVIAPCIWTLRYIRIIRMLKDLPDSEILRTCSTSPSAEGPDFVDNLRRHWEYLLANPDWRATYPNRRPRVFKRTSEGGWVRCTE